MSIAHRAKSILLDPKGTWPAIEQEAASVRSIYVPYVVILAAISAVAGFIGLSLVGVSAFGTTVRVPIGTGLAQMVLGFVLGLVMVWLMALVVDALAPVFGGRKDRIAALKVVAYGSTAGFLGGLFSLIPALAILGLVAALYSVWLIHTGLPVLMKAPSGKALPYTAAVVACGIALSVLVASLLSLIAPPAPSERAVPIATPRGDATVQSRGLEEAARSMEEATKKMEAAEAKGDLAGAAAAAAAAAAVVGAIAGTPQRKPVAAAALQALLPESVAGMARESVQVESDGSIGVAGSAARGSYRDGERQLTLSITDTGGLAGVMALAGWADMTIDRETDAEIERVYKKGRRSVREQYSKDTRHGEVAIVLPNGVLVEAEGEGLALEVMQKAIEEVNLGQLEEMR